MTASQQNIERLGFFESVEVEKVRDKDLMHVSFKVKERSTGQLQAALIFTPAGGGVRSGWSGQGKYDEKNLIGKGWNSNFTARWSGNKNFSLNLGFSEPRVANSKWRLGGSLYLMRESRRYVENKFLDESKHGMSFTIGRKIYEHISGALTYNLQRTTLGDDAYVIRKLREIGLESSLTISFSRNATNNYLEPSSGSEISLYQVIAGGGVLRGDTQYLETGLDASYYIPLDFADNYRTYFRIRGLLSHIYPFGDEPVPFVRRYRLGGYMDMRGFPYWDLGSKFYVLRSPNEPPTEFNYGGDKKLLMQFEYYIPLIEEARIKALLFTDIGQVYKEEESLSLRNLEADVGFGIRWITPIAPLRFEWAYPVENGKLGDMEFVFYLGF